MQSLKRNGYILNERVYSEPTAAATTTTHSKYIQHLLAEYALATKQSFFHVFIGVPEVRNSVTPWDDCDKNLWVASDMGLRVVTACVAQ